MTSNIKIFLAFALFGMATHGYSVSMECNTVVGGCKTVAGSINCFKSQHPDAYKELVSKFRSGLLAHSAFDIELLDNPAIHIDNKS
ncbi:MAG: hypothetical protein Q8K36_05615, partial [Alphaproteobacteria bacterium]|nr:hypothetical protein [Alphaproteobacteria bacterium]